jgi:hypothetical protein
LWSQGRQQSRLEVLQTRMAAEGIRVLNAGTADLEVLLSRSLLVAVPRRVHISVDDVRVGAAFTFRSL